MNQDETFLALLESHGDALWRIARAYAGSEGEEDDLHQEILAQVWSSLPNFRGHAAAGTWMYRVALNTALTWRRRTRKHSVGRVALDSTGGMGPVITHGSPGSEAAVLAEFLGSLGGPDHAVLLLYMEGLSYQNISDVTGFSVSAIGVRIHRMRRAFTQRYVER